MSEVTKYKVFCNDENDYIETWSTKVPTSCPNNYRHTLDLTKTVKLEVKIEGGVQLVKMLEENIPTNGNYRYETFKFSIPSNTSSNCDITFPYPVNVLGVSTVTGETNRGDVINALIIPKEPSLGSLLSNLNIGDSNLSGCTSTINYMNPGYILTLSDGNNTECLGEVLKVNPYTNTLTTQYAASNAYSSNATVQRNIYYVKNLHITEPREYSVGSKKIGASYVPEGYTIRTVYKNNSQTDAKDVVIHFEYLY